MYITVLLFQRTTEDAQLEVNGKVEIYLWLGLAANIGKCLERLPEGSEDLSGFYELPRYIRYPNSSVSFHFARSSISTKATSHSVSVEFMLYTKSIPRN